MDATSILKNAAQSAVGQIEKAMIEPTDEGGGETPLGGPVSRGGGSLAAGLSAIPGGLEGFRDAASSALKAGVSAVGAAAASYLGGPTRKCFYVQFNPSELSLSGYGGGQVAKTVFSDQGGKIKYESAAVHITLNVKLIFDKVDPLEAFMSDKLSASTTAMAQGAVRSARRAVGKKDDSVQKEVEGFMAALRSQRTRRIIFHWGTMHYPGVLNRVSSQYTMFNVNGQPIRAVVSLSLVCADEEVSPGDMGIWQQHYEEAFQGKDRSYVKAAQKAGNLLNFNL